MIAIIDYGMGNLRSVQKALEKVGAAAQITQDPQTLKNADKVVLPGVGAIKPAMEKLCELNLLEPIKEIVNTRKPFLGICLGLQLLFEKSDEGCEAEGLGIIKGTVQRFTQLKVPHMGWNQIRVKQKDCPLFQDIPDESYAYFCHSFYVCCQETSDSATTTDYGVDFTSSVARDNIMGVQFHPEKSQELGLKILKNFNEVKS